MRCAFMMRLRPGALDAYREYHRFVWPELEREFELAGIDRCSIFEAAGLVVIVSEACDEQAWARLRGSPVHQRWSALIEPLVRCGPDGTIETVNMTELYRYEGG